MTQKKFGGHVILTLTRWNEDQPPTPDNLVLIMQNEAKILAEQGRSAFPVEVVQRIVERLAWAKLVYDKEFIHYDAGPLELFENHSYKKQNKTIIGNGGLGEDTFLLATTAGLSLFFSGVMIGVVTMMVAFRNKIEIR